MNEQNAVRLAVIGAGNHSQVQHGPGLKAYADKYPDRIKLSAICDLDRGKAKSYANTFGFARVYDRIDDMLEKENPEGLIAVTPLQLTRNIAGTLLERKIPLMIEKPPGKDVAEAMDLLKIADRTGTPHVISFNRRFSPAVMKARNWIAEKLPERKPLAIAARMLRTRRIEPDFVTGTGIHLVDAVLSFMERPTQACTEKVKTADSYSWFSTITCENGGCASLVIAPCSGVPDEEVYEIYGDEYRLRIDFFEESLIVYDHGVCVLDWKLPQDADPAYRGGCVGEVENFVEYIRDIKRGNTEKRLKPDLLDGLYSMRTAETIMPGGSGKIEQSIKG